MKTINTSSKPIFRLLNGCIEYLIEHTRTTERLLLVKEITTKMVIS